MTEYNLIHDILNHYKGIKNMNSNYSPITHGCINTCRGNLILKFLILLDSVCSFIILTRISMPKIKQK